MKKLKDEINNSNRLSWVKEEFDILKNPKTYATDPDQSWKRLGFEGKIKILLKL